MRCRKAFSVITLEEEGRKAHIHTSKTRGISSSFPGLLIPTTCKEWPEAKTQGPGKRAGALCDTTPCHTPLCCWNYLIQIQVNRSHSCKQKTLISSTINKINISPQNAYPNRGNELLNTETIRTTQRLTS